MSACSLCNNWITDCKCRGIPSRPSREPALNQALKRALETLGRIASGAVCCGKAKQEAIQTVMRIEKDLECTPSQK